MHGQFNNDNSKKKEGLGTKLGKHQKAWKFIFQSVTTSFTRTFSRNVCSRIKIYSFSFSTLFSIFFLCFLILSILFCYLLFMSQHDISMTTARKMKARERGQGNTKSMNIHTPIRYNVISRINYKDLYIVFPRYLVVFPAKSCSNVTIVIYGTQLPYIIAGVHEGE